MGNLTKKAILVVSFGTSHEDTRKVTIDAIEETIGAAFPQYRIYRAWTSKMILAKIEKRDHIHYDNVKEAMERMAQDGIRRGDRSANSRNEWSGERSYESRRSCSC